MMPMVRNLLAQQIRDDEERLVAERKGIYLVLPYYDVRFFECVILRC